MVVEGAKCEELEKIVIDDNEEVFPSGSLVTYLGEGRVGCLP